MSKHEPPREKAASKASRPNADWADPGQLHCIIIFDVVTHQSVGTNCYVVGSLPTIGAVETYDTFPAEFVASSQSLSLRDDLRVHEMSSWYGEAPSVSRTPTSEFCHASARPT